MKNETSVVSRSPGPVTRSRIAAQLRDLGVEPGDVLLVHASLSALGWVCGGAVAVVHALLDTVGHQGTLVMPTHTAGNTDPGHWENPPVPRDWWDTIRQEMPAFDPRLSPSFGMGAIAECFRQWPGAIRSTHPIGSFAALGPLARALTADHGLEPMFGRESPIGRLYDSDGKVMLLGVGHDSNTSLHLAEYEAEFTRREIDESCARVRRSAEQGDRPDREWVTFRMLALETDDFGSLGTAYEACAAPGDFIRGQVGLAETKLFRQRPMVDFAIGWMSEHRA